MNSQPTDQPTQRPDDKSHEPGELPGESTSPRAWTSEQLLGESNEVLIVHGSETYRLLRTRNQKLMLVK